MKTDIHPKYFADAVMTCVCGAKYQIGSTRESIEVEICAACHPFYTGQEKVMDTQGRVDRFKKRQAKAAK
jgi:large subunit ribosomal protein L31